VTKRAWTPPPKLTVSEWADKERKLSPEASAEPGQWRTDRAPYQRGMMDAVNDPAVERVCIMSSAQIGKTEALNNVVGFYVSYDPAPIMVLQPTLDMAQAWSKDRLAPMLRDSPCLKEVVSKSSAKTSGNTLLHKSFPGGHVTMAGANSPASLASRPIRVVLADEIDRYPPSAGTEGDPLSLVKKRTATFWNRKIIVTSTPTIKGASRIEMEWEASDKRRFHVPCPHCGHKQHLQWKSVVFEDPENVVYACEQGCVIEESDKLWMLKHGEWIAELPFNGNAGFHLNELYSPWRKWREIVADFKEMKKSPETLKTWVNTSLGETWEDKGDEVDHTGLMERCEAYDEDSLPDDIAVITASVDTQGDRLEFLSQGWGVESERWNIEHKIFWGDPNKREVWDELDTHLLTKYQVGPRKLNIACCVVDSGGHHTDAVYNFCKKRQARRVFAIKGSSQYYDPIVSKPSQVGRNRVMLYKVGSDTGKDRILFSSLKITEGPNAIHFPHTCDEEFFKQLTGEVRKIEFSRGMKRQVWVKKRDRQEILDLHVYNLAAYAILNPDIGAILAKREVRAPKEEAKLAKTTQKRRIVRNKKNWATDF
tara:strand:- start:3381 stop:5162 length:1782 start_codon:yes stop_codon:yes gene_type:complete